MSDWNPKLDFLLAIDQQMAIMSGGMVMLEVTMANDTGPSTDDKDWFFRPVFMKKADLPLKEKIINAIQNNAGADPWIGKNAIIEYPISLKKDVFNAICEFKKSPHYLWVPKRAFHGLIVHSRDYAGFRFSTTAAGMNWGSLQPPYYEEPEIKFTIPEEMKLPDWMEDAKKIVLVLTDFIPKDKAVNLTLNTFFYRDLQLFMEHIPEDMTVLKMNVMWVTEQFKINHEIQTGKLVAKRQRTAPYVIFDKEAEDSA